MSDTDRPWEMAPRGSLVTRAIASVLPTIETERLVLRAPRMEDFSAYAEIATSDRWFSEPLTRRDAWLDFSQLVSGWLLAGTGLLSVDRSKDGRLVGFVLVYHEFGDPEMELGWLLSAEAEGHGYATEAALALREHVERAQGLHRLVSYIGDDNLRSIRVAERLHAVRDKAAEAAIEQRCRVYRHPAARA